MPLTRLCEFLNAARRQEPLHPSVPALPLGDLAGELVVESGLGQDFARIVGAPSADLLDAYALAITAGLAFVAPVVPGSANGLESHRTDSNDITVKTVQPETTAHTGAKP